MPHPHKLGKYPITGVLGEGAMGVVYQGFDPVIKRPVALKTIHRDLIAGDDVSGSSAAARFRNEAQAVGRLSHPGIVAIYEYGEEDTTAFIAMELVEGRSLSSILASTPRLPETDVLSIMDQLLDALDCAHRYGVWHRDIKPANLLITAGGRLKVTDFGIARIESQQLTQVTATIGTPGYMAPEQYVGNRIDHRVDLFAAGVLLYRLLSGEPPFIGTPEAVMYQILNRDPPVPSSLPNSRTHPFYDAIVAKALARDADERFASASAFREALAHRTHALPRHASDETVIAAPMPPKPAAAATPIASGPPTHPSNASMPPEGWNPDTLLQFERALASFVGPMARVLVRRAAREHADLSDLAHALASQLEGDAERTMFFQKLEKTGPSLRGTAALSSGTPPPQATPASALPVRPETIERAKQLLAQHMGPIAGIVVKKAVAKADGDERFIALVLEQVADEAEREKLRQALRRR